VGGRQLRTSQGAAAGSPRSFSGPLGYLSGIDANGGNTATVAMTSDRWAAIRREQRLLNRSSSCATSRAGRRWRRRSRPRRSTGGPPRLLVRDTPVPVRSTSTPARARSTG
jgi:hypothetical protein